MITLYFPASFMAFSERSYQKNLSEKPNNKEQPNQDIDNQITTLGYTVENAWNPTIIDEISQGKFDNLNQLLEITPELAKLIFEKMREYANWQRVVVDLSWLRTIDTESLTYILGINANRLNLRNITSLPEPSQNTNRSNNIERLDLESLTSLEAKHKVWLENKESVRLNKLTTYDTWVNTALSGVNWVELNETRETHLIELFSNINNVSRLILEEDIRLTSDIISTLKTRAAVRGRTYDSIQFNAKPGNYELSRQDLQNLEYIFDNSDVRISMREWKKYSIKVENIEVTLQWDRENTLSITHNWKTVKNLRTREAVRLFNTLLQVKDLRDNWRKDVPFNCNRSLLRTEYQARQNERAYKDWNGIWFDGIWWHRNQILIEEKEYNKYWIDNEEQYTSVVKFLNAFWTQLRYLTTDE